MATKDEAEIEVEGDEDDVNPYQEYDIASFPSDYSLEMIAKKLIDNDFIIPDFQRNFVWTIKQSSMLIESFLLGLPVPQAFLYIDRDKKSLVVDGQQRMLSIRFFLEGYFGAENPNGKRQVFRLTGLNPKSPYVGKRFEDLDDASQRKLKMATLRVVNIQQLSPDNDSTSVYHIFERLNTGGTPLRPQEIRNCVFYGPIVEQFDKLNTLESWRSIIGKKRLDKHNRDSEMLLRVFAMVLDHAEYEKPMKEFLNKRMKRSRFDKQEEVSKFAAGFAKVAGIVQKQFPEKPFHVRGPLNLAALDSVMSVLIQHIGKIPADVGKRYGQLRENKEYQASIFFNTSDPPEVETRLRLAKKYLIAGK